MPNDGRTVDWQEAAEAVVEGFVEAFDIEYRGNKAMSYFRLNCEQNNIERLVRFYQFSSAFVDSLQKSITPPVNQPFRTEQPVLMAKTIFMIIRA